MATTKKAAARKPAAKPVVKVVETIVEDPVIKIAEDEYLVKDIPNIKIVDEHGNKYRMEPDFARGKYILRPRL